MSRRILPIPRLIRAAGLALALAMFPAIALGEAPQSNSICPSSISVPISLELTAPEGSIAPGAVVTLTGTFLPGTELASAELAISSEGSVELLGPAVLTSGPLANGQAWVFEIPVRFTASGRSAVFVRALADDGTGGARFEKNEGIYTIFHGNRPVVAMGDYLRAELRAIEQDLDSGVLTETEARAQMREKSRPERVLNFTLPSTQNAPPPPSSTQVIAPDPARRLVPPVQQGVRGTVSGRASGMDRKSVV